MTKEEWALVTFLRERFFALWARVHAEGDPEVVFSNIRVVMNENQSSSLWNCSLLAARDLLRLLAPGLLDDATTRNALGAHAGIREVTDLWDRLDVAVFGIGAPAWSDDHGRYGQTYVICHECSKK